MCEMRRKAGILNCLICSGIFAGFALYIRMSPLSYTYSVECLLSTVLVGLSFRFILPLVADGRLLNSCIRLCPGCSGWRRHRLRSGIRSSKSGLRRFLWRGYVRREAGLWRRTSRAWLGQSRWDATHPYCWCGAAGPWRRGAYTGVWQGCSLGRQGGFGAWSGPR
jgi:hypothetical protein